MAKYHYCEQYTDEWDRLRRGIPTSSAFNKLITAASRPSTQWKGYAHHLIAERIMDRTIDTYTNEFMARGYIMEEEAVATYELVAEVEVKRVGFVTNDEGTIGCSPDALIGDNGLLEIKSPKEATQVGYLVDKQVDRVYWPQIQGQLYVTEREWVDICAYHPEMPPSIIRVERDEKFIECLEKQLKDFLMYVDGCTNKINQMRTNRGESQ